MNLCDLYYEGKMKFLILFYITLLLKDNTATVCDVPDGRDPCIYNSHIKMPYIATRNPLIRYTSYTDDDRYCDLFALAHGQWYSTFYNMTTYCVDHRACGSSGPMYLNGTIPQPSDGIVNRTACVRTFEQCCEKTLRLRIKNCYYFMVYCFVDLNPACHSRFCLDTDTSFETTSSPTKATTTTSSSSSARMKKIVVEPEEQRKHHALVVGLIVMVVYSAIVSTVAAFLEWKLCCQHRARVSGKIYQQQEGFFNGCAQTANDPNFIGGLIEGTRSNGNGISLNGSILFPNAFGTKPTVNTPQDGHAKI